MGGFASGRFRRSHPVIGVLQQAQGKNEILVKVPNGMGLVRDGLAQGQAEPNLLVLIMTVDICGPIKPFPCPRPGIVIVGPAIMLAQLLAGERHDNGMRTFKAGMIAWDSIFALSFIMVYAKRYPDGLRISPLDLGPQIKPCFVQYGHALISPSLKASTPDEPSDLI